jgi:hypothetical protein
MKHISIPTTAAFLVTIGIVLILIFSFLPISAEAAGLVPCGGGSGEPECSVCDLVTLADNVINFIIQLSFVISALLFAYAGFLFFTAGADPGKVTSARKIFTNAIIGIIIILTAWLLVNVLLTVLTGDSAGRFTGILKANCGYVPEVTTTTNNTDTTAEGTEDETNPDPEPVTGWFFRTSLGGVLMGPYSSSAICRGHASSLTEEGLYVYPYATICDGREVMSDDIIE